MCREARPSATDIRGQYGPSRAYQETGKRQAVSQSASQSCLSRRFHPSTRNTSYSWKKKPSRHVRKHSVSSVCFRHYRKSFPENVFRFPCHRRLAVKAVCEGACLDTICVEVEVPSPRLSAHIFAPERGGWGGYSILMHGRSRMTIDPRSRNMPGRRTTGVHQPGRHCLHQARSAVRCSASRMKGELHPSKSRS